MEPIAHNYSNEIVQTVREPLLVLDTNLRVVVCSPSFYRTFNTTPQQTVNRLIYELGNGQWDIPALRNLLDHLLPGNGHFDDYQVEHDFPGIGRRTMLLNARRLHDGPETPPLILLAIEDTTDRRRAELEITRQKAWFQTTLASIGDAVIATDPSACVIYMNPIAEAMTGWHSRDAQGRALADVFNIVNEESRTPVESPVSKSIRLGGIVGLANHTVLIAKDGTERPIDDSAAPIRDADGRITGVVMVFHDITDRRAAERMLAQSEDQYRTLFNSSEEGFCVIDLIFDDRGNAQDYRFLATNPAFEKQTGLSSSVGKRIRELAPDHDPQWFAMYGKVALTGKAIRFINEGKDAGDASFDIYAFRLGGAESRRVGLLFADISERRRAEQALANSELRYRRLFEAAHDGIIVMHAETHLISDVNPFMLKLLDQPREYFLGKALWQIGVFKNAAENDVAMQDCHARGSCKFQDVELKDRNGRPHPVEIVANLYQEADHRVIQCNLRDVSERVRAERERQAMLANEQSLRIESEAANRAKDTFLATLSHELRTPLNAILGWSVLLRSAPADQESVVEASTIIERNARMQQQLIEDVLDVSRIVSGKLWLEMKPAELSRIVEDAVSSVQQAADAKQIKIEVLVVSGASPIICDAARVQQMVWNLLTNAIKFSHNVGDIEVRVERVNSTARIIVTDHGEGIPADFLPHVFERFRQKDGSSTRKHGGLGLGLSIVRQLAELHGGSISAESEGPGKGAKFTLTLPVRAVAVLESGESRDNNRAHRVTAPVASGAADVPAPVRLDGLRILTVDDEADARAVIKAALEMAGARVAVADSVSRALELLPEVRPHLIVSDLSMPVQDGYDLIAQVRAKGEGYTARELPAIALTAYATPEDRRRVWAAGYQMHVAKPVDPHELTAVIASQLGLIGTVSRSTNRTV